MPTRGGSKIVKIRKPSLKEILILMIVYNGCNGIIGVVQDNCFYAGCSIGLGLILIYLRGKFC